MSDLDADRNPYVSLPPGTVDSRIGSNGLVMEYRIKVSDLAAAGYHVVQEGQAVVDGKVWRVEEQWTVDGDFHRLVPVEDSDD